MSVPRWAARPLRRLAPTDHAEDVVVDLEEVHRARVQRRGVWAACLLTALDALDMAIAFAIWVGAGTFAFASQLAFPKLPLEDGHRIVGIRVWDASAGRIEPRVLTDFLQR